MLPDNYQMEVPLLTVSTQAGISSDAALDSNRGQLVAMENTAVPVASMNENGRMELREDDIRTAWQVAVFQVVPEPESMQSTSKNPFRLRVAAAHLRHCKRSLLFREDVGHQSVSTRTISE